MDASFDQTSIDYIRTVPARFESSWKKIEGIFYNAPSTTLRNLYLRSRFIFLKGEEVFFYCKIFVTGLRVRLPYLESKHKLRNEDDVISRSAHDKWPKSLEAERSRMRRQRAGIDEIIRNRQMARLRAIKYRYLLPLLYPLLPFSFLPCLLNYLYI